MEKSRYENLAAVLTKINNCLQEREEKVRRFRKVLSIWIKASFKEALNIRNLDGKATFDFEKETLTLLAQKRRAGTASDPMRLSSQSKRDQQQSVSMMSGGKRSFATVAFILALWEVIHSPVRILDEFDVDIVSRRQSLDMMLTGAKPNVQYLFLTSLEINRSDYSVNLNVLRMPDPERKSST
ncbi:hypothetical protein SK128_008976 [Halocaridina rubra]|uniref:RecF/RecN/SMC N-terminal domain-containing protein n=1 Tax=Halocaridina rubra TaxID=373956 RepID=A0AAN8WEM8_HALRR